MLGTDEVDKSRFPEDVLNRIMYECLYREGEFSVYRQPDDLTGDLVDVKAGRASFRRTFATVSRSVYIAATNLLWKAIYLESGRELSGILGLLEDTNHRQKGALCIRIETRIRGAYLPGDLATLLEKTPNLKVFINRNPLSWDAPVLRIRPIAVFEALSLHTLGLQRIQLESPDEEPTVREVLSLLTAQTRLKTLHIDQVGRWGFSDRWEPIQHPVRSLEVFSMGSMKRGEGSMETRRFWDEVLRGIGKGGILPNLKEFHVEECTSGVWTFLSTYGHQIQHLGFGSADRRCGSGTNHHILNLCPSASGITLFCAEGYEWENASTLRYPPDLESAEMVMMDIGSRNVQGVEVVVRDVLNHLVKWKAALARVVIVRRAKGAAFGEEEWYKQAVQALGDRGTTLCQYKSMDWVEEGQGVTRRL